MFKLLSILLSVVLLSACGGNSSSSTSLASPTPLETNPKSEVKQPIINTEELTFEYNENHDYQAQLDISDEDNNLYPSNITVSFNHDYITASIDNNLILSLHILNLAEVLKQPNNDLTITITGEFSSVTKTIPIAFTNEMALTATTTYSGSIKKDNLFIISFDQPVDDSQITTSKEGSCEGNIQISEDDFLTCIAVNQPTSTQVASLYPANNFYLDNSNLVVNTHYKIKIKKELVSLFNSSLAEDLVIEFLMTAGLMVTEISSIEYSDDNHWFEIYNASLNEINLANYSFKTPGLDTSSCVNNQCDTVFQHTFDLPNKIIQPGQFMLVHTQYWNEKYTDTDRVIYMDGAIRPYWDSDGFIELINNISLTTTDLVMFGSSDFFFNPSPLNTQEWPGERASGLIFEINRPLKRNANLVDTNSASDWSIGNFSTPGGPNDVECTEDNDLDGIPDCSERLGSTFAGVSLYDLGARENQRDIFIELDYMNSTDEGIIPRREALQKVVDSFALQDIAIHFDAGDLFDKAEGINPDNFDLGGGNQVPFSAGIGMGVPSYDKRADLYTIKRENFSFSRMPIFHYMLMANSQNEDGEAGSGGLGEINANDFLISLGNWGLNSDTDADLNMLINYQASTIMHELGHNLGLLHGGYEDKNHKPNYLSTMNYMYQLEGLPTIGDNEGDRYYYHTDLMYSDTNCNPNNIPMTNAYDADYRNFIIDFSNGTSGILQERTVIETQGLLRPGSSGIDFDCDNTISAVAAPIYLDNDNNLTSLNDYNDWLYINLRFQTTYGGSTNGISLFNKQADDLFLVQDVIGNDRAKLIYETPPTEEFLNRIRNR